MSYIVKNCPCYEFGFCTSHHIKVRGCIDCTDCVTKQVIEKCKGAVFNYSNLEILRTACEASEAYGKANIAEQILQLFDIEEINK
jgi:hypothetical protein